MSEDKFVDCAVEVIEDWIFPSFKHDIPMAIELSPNYEEIAYMEKVEDVLKKEITPKIDQCRKDFPSDQHLTLYLTIKANGVLVINKVIPENIRKDNFVKCAIAMFEVSIFPPFREDHSEEFYLGIFPDGSSRLEYISNRGIKLIRIPTMI
ncbi:MAG: hypothetical protein WAW61_02315 [Methylococcaceae bacterium]